jgi:hypothetical protein
LKRSLPLGKKPLELNEQKAWWVPKPVITTMPFVGCNNSFTFILPPAPVAVKNSEEGLSKLPVHEAVSDGVTAGTDIGEQLH